MTIHEGTVIASADGLFLLVLGRDENRGSADQWLCMVLGDFYDGRSMISHQPGALDVFCIRVDMSWEVVAP